MVNKPTYEELEQRIRELEQTESELERVKLALQESEELYRTLIEFSPLPILVTQEEKIVFANPAAARLFGTCHQDEIIGSSPKDWTHPVSAEHAYHRRREAIELGKALAPVELVIVRKDKKEAIVIANATLISHHGSPALLSVFNDVTVERHVTEALSKSEERLLQSNQILSGVLEHTHMMTVFLDTQFNFIWVNRAYADTCKHEPDFFPGKNHFNLYPHEENHAIFQRVVDTGEPFFAAAKPFEFPNQPERGITYWD
jgi:PAS domain S-box-containing protein